MVSILGMYNSFLSLLEDDTESNPLTKNNLHAFGFHLGLKELIVGFS
jgi:hypothetical protein